MKLIEGKPTKSGKTTYLYLNDKGEKVSLLPVTAKKKGYKPVLKEEKIVENVEKIVKVDKKQGVSNTEIISKSPKEILQEYLFKNKSCQILKNGKIIFTNGNPIEYEEDGFRINDKKYEYTGIRLKKIK